MPATDTPAAPGPGPGALARCADLTAAATDAMGHAASAIMLVLTLAIILGVVMRWVGIDNSWTYDLDLFALVWVAFAGASYTALRGRHVTAGIAIENMIGRGALLGALRFVIVFGFLLLFLTSSIWDTMSSWQTGETTIDVDQWPVWIAKLSLPVGIGFWALAELSRALRILGGAPAPADGELALDD